MRNTILSLPLLWAVAIPVWAEPLPGGTLDPALVPKYVTPVVIPPAMPRAGKIKPPKGKGTANKQIDYYEIAVRQFQQQILPPTDVNGNAIPPTTVWSYGAPQLPGHVTQGGSFHYPAFTIEAKYITPVRVKWINDLKDPVTGNYLQHLLPVDQTLHWANPPGGEAGKDKHGHDSGPYTGPVPIVTHVHGAHVGPESDGYPEAWWLPDANNIPAGYATKGTFYEQFDPTNTTPGSAVYQYPNDQRATTLWYHDHTLGMTRLNVYAGPAGFYLLRGGPSDLAAGLPGPAPAQGDAPGTQYYEIPLGIQDRSFNADGSLWFPDNRAFFEGLAKNQLQIPFIPEMACDGLMSDIHPIWNPEFFGNMMVVNGYTWPAMTVEPRRYRFRFLNGCNSRFLILKLFSGNPDTRPTDAVSPAALPFWQIGTEGGFLPAPIMLDQLLMGPAERADCIIDFTGLPAGTELYLINEGPDEPFGGGVPGVDFAIADPGTTGQVMKFVVGSLMSVDTSTPPAALVLPRLTPLGPPDAVRQVSLNEVDSSSVRVSEQEGNVVLDCASDTPFGPKAALLGTMQMGMPMPMMWMDGITENPLLNTTEVWEIYNFTMDAHPIHLHMVMFQVVDREPLMRDETDPEMIMMPAMGTGVPRLPEVWEVGYKDTVIAYPGEITRVKAKFDVAGLYVWHCHIVDHEDNEMMRPYMVEP